MKKLPAQQLGNQHLGLRVSCEDHNGLHVDGFLLDVQAPSGAMYAYLTVDGQTYAVTKLTPVEVA